MVVTARISRDNHFTESNNMRISIVALLCFAAICTAIADDNADDKFVMNLDLRTKTADGGDGYSINLKGIHLPDGKVLQEDLAEFRYFLTVSGSDEHNGKLTIELYEYESRNKTSEVISEIVSEVEFSFGQPSQFQAKNERFGIDLAFSISQL